LYLVASWSLATIIIAISLIDIYYYWLPKSLNYLLIFLGIFINTLILSDASNLSSPYEIINNVLSAFLGYLLIRVIAYISKLVYKKDALGLGDALFVSGTGAWNSILGLYFSLIISFILAGMFVFIGILIRRIDKRGYIPLGPFLASGTLIVWCIGKENLLRFLI